MKNLLLIQLFQFQNASTSNNKSSKREHKNAEIKWKAEKLSSFPHELVKLCEILPLLFFDAPKRVRGWDEVFESLIFKLDNLYPQLYVLFHPQRFHFPGRIDSQMNFFFRVNI